jgi:hypothetical protein
MSLRYELAQFLEPKIREYLRTCPPELLEDVKALHKAMEAESMGYGVNWSVIEKGLEALKKIYKFL